MLERLCVTICFVLKASNSKSVKEYKKGGLTFTCYQYLQLTVTSRRLWLSPMVFDAVHMNSPWSIIDIDVIISCAPYTTVVSGLVHVYWQGGLHLAEQVIGPIVSSFIFMTEVTLGSNCTVDPGPTTIKKC